MTTAKADAPPAHDNIAAALAAFQSELPKVGKDNTARVTSDKGSYQYRYADLAEISPVVLPLLAKQGLAWTTRPTLTHDARFVLRYALTHTSGEVINGDWPLPNPASSPQVLGSAVTYARRYALCAVTGVAPGDDDDDAAAQRAPQPPQARSRPANTTPPATGAQGASQAAARPQDSRPEPEPAAPSARAARDLLRSTCEQNKWSLARVSALYAETHGGADLRQASMREVEEFRKSLFGRADHELRDQPAEEEAQ